MTRNFQLTLLLFLLATVSFAQKGTPLYSLCGKSGNCAMSWDEFMSCRKVLAPVDKSIQIGTFMVTIQQASKKDTLSIEFPSKGGVFSKSSLETIEKLHKQKKMGGKVVIDAVQILQSGKDARKGPSMTIYLN